MPEQAPHRIKIHTPKKPTPTIVDFGIDEKLNKKSKLLLLLSGWPVLIYPFVFISLIIAMTEPKPPGLPWIPLIIGACFRSVCLGYPCVFVPCAVGAIAAARKKDRRKEFKYAKSAFYYFLFVVCLGILASLVSF
jgi:hypothetical protein